MIDLEKLMKLHDAATPGPWEMVDARAFLDDEDFEIRNGQHCIGYGTSEADAQYIVAACNSVPEPCGTDTGARVGTCWTIRHFIGLEDEKET